MASLTAFNKWLEDDWGFSYHDRLIAAPMIAAPTAALVRCLAVAGATRRSVSAWCPTTGPRNSGRVQPIEAIRLLIAVFLAGYLREKREVLAELPPELVSGA